MPFGLGPSRAPPSTVTLPRSGRSKPAMMFIKVDLPQPDGPTMATNSPSSTSKPTLSITGSAPRLDTKPLLTPSTTIFLADIAPSHGLDALEQARDAVEQQTDHADDDHRGDHQVVAVAGVARIHD